MSNSYSSSTQATLKAERLRVESVIARNAILDEVVVASDDILLDYDEKSSEQIKIHPRIAEKLMPHQIEGIKHMYDCCYASIQHVRDKYASGCILSHMMGLGIYEIN